MIFCWETRNMGSTRHPAYASFRGWNFRILGIITFVLVALAGCASAGAIRPENFDLYNYLLEAEGVSTRPAEAVSFLTDEAEKGSIEAQFKLGVFYYTGTGVPQNFKQAFSYFSKAAKEGDARAQLVTGILCAKGHGTTLNIPEAKRLLDLATRKKGEIADTARQVLQGIEQDELKNSTK